MSVYPLVALVLHAPRCTSLHTRLPFCTSCVPTAFMLHPLHLPWPI